MRQKVSALDGLVHSETGALVHGASVDQPDFSLADIPDSKLSGYLLSNTHPAGRPKAEFLIAAGFSAARPDDLANALREHATKRPVDTVTVTRFGTKYVIEGPVQTPNCGQVSLRSVWFLEKGQTRVRFVTAYPVQGHGS